MQPLMLIGAVPVIRRSGQRGFVDAVIAPDVTHAALAPALRTSLNNPGPQPGRLRPAAAGIAARGWRKKIHS
jgi:hypothetical protein